MNIIIITKLYLIKVIVVMVYLSPRYFNGIYQVGIKTINSITWHGAIHDSLYTLKGANLFTREECDDVFRGLLRDAGISRMKAGLADMSVGLFAGGDKHWGNDTWNNKNKIHVKNC